MVIRVHAPHLLVYVAGPYNAPTPWGVERNIQRARSAGARLAWLGFTPIIPHANTAHFGGIQDDEAFWYEGTLEVCGRCDAIGLLPQWERSSGARREHALMGKLERPAFPVPVPDWTSPEGRPEPYPGVFPHLDQPLIKWALENGATPRETR